MVEIDHAAEAQVPRAEHDDVLYRAFVQFCADALTLVDRDGVMLYNSPSSERILGYTADQLLGLNLFDIIHPDDLQVSREHFGVALKEPRGRAEGVSRMRRADGVWRWMEGSAVNLLHEPGVNAIVLTYHDITERRFAENRFRNVVENLNEGLLVTDFDDRILYANGRLAEMTGYSLDELEGSLAYELLMEEGKDIALQRNDTRGRGISDQYEMEMRRKDGSKFWVVVSAAPFYDAEGVITGTQGAVIDVSERKLAEEELDKRNRKLEEISRRLVRVQISERTAIARDLHDEIGQLLTGLKLQLHAIERMPQDKIEAQIQSALSTSEDLLRRVRFMSLDLRPPMLDDYGLQRALQWHVEQFQRNTGIEVKLDNLVQERLSMEVETTAFRIIQEALTNVARHSASAQAQVSLSILDRQLTVDVTDNGSGFSLDALMESRSSGVVGMRERAQLIGGVLTVESFPGRGTSVCAVLPLQQRSGSRRALRPASDRISNPAQAAISQSPKRT